MVNYRVEDLHALVEVLREEGCNVLDKIDDSEYGQFAWVIDMEYRLYVRTAPVRQILLRL